MYYVIPEHERKSMSKKEIREVYSGKWVFLTNVKDNPFSAIPTVIADKSYGGTEDGIYEQFEDVSEYGTTSYISLLLSASMLGFETF